MNIELKEVLARSKLVGREVAIKEVVASVREYLREELPFSKNPYKPEYLKRPWRPSVPFRDSTKEKIQRLQDHLKQKTGEDISVGQILRILVELNLSKILKDIE